MCVSLDCAYFNYLCRNRYHLRHGLHQHSQQDFDPRMLNDYLKKLEADTFDVLDDSNSTILSDCPYDSGRFNC